MTATIENIVTNTTPVAPLATAHRIETIQALLETLGLAPDGHADEIDALQAALIALESIDHADQMAGQAIRRIERYAEQERSHQAWLNEAKRAAGYDLNTSFDVVWKETLALALRDDAPRPNQAGRAPVPCANAEEPPHHDDPRDEYNYDADVRCQQVDDRAPSEEGQHQATDAKPDRPAAGAVLLDNPAANTKF